MTHLESLKDLVEKEPWKIIRSIWDCFSCPMLPECNKIKPTTEESCKNLITEWLDMEEKEDT